MSADDRELDQPQGKWWPWVRSLFLPVSLLLIACAVFIVPLPVYAERPGSSLDLTECLSVGDPSASPISGDLLLTFATFRKATVADLITSIGAEDVLLRPVARVVPEDLEPADYFARGREVFDASGRTAAAVGLDRAGYPQDSRITGDGARVVRTLEGYPAAQSLRANDIVVGVGDQGIATSDELQELILTRGADDELRFRVHRGGAVETIPITPVIRELEGERRPLIGATLQTVNPRVDLPVDVDIRAGRIGGPSAGLMIALDVYDAVADEDLVAGRRIAGTGEIDANGRVGRIGALPLKVIAADRQGASVFLAPASQADTARAALPEGTGMRVIGVETIDEAITALRNLPPAETEPPVVRFRACRERVVGTEISQG